MTQALTNYSRIINAVTALSLIGVIVLPLWSIELTAPQYPEGLQLLIYSYKLGGNVDVVNGLNHYIGMRTLHAKDFPEFLVLPYIIGTLVFFGLLSTLLNKRGFFLAWVAFYLIFSATAMMDFYRWEYNYGHNLDPTAPIQVPGMAYQPPLIGYKQLLNFSVYSIPASGGWIFIGVALLLLLAVFLEWKAFQKQRSGSVTLNAVLALLLLTGLTSCNHGPQPIRLGQQECAHCKMTIIDPHFGGEIITKKGKLLYFDDIGCILAYLQSEQLKKEQLKEVYLVDYSRSGDFVKVEQGYLLKSASLHSPMGSNLVAFQSRDSQQYYREPLAAIEVDWSALLHTKP